MGRKGFEKFAPKERPIAMGQLLEVATPDEAQRMFADLPLPVRILWRVAGKRQYRRHVAGVRGKQLSPWLQRVAGKANHLPSASTGGRAGRSAAWRRVFRSSSSPSEGAVPGGSGPLRSSI